MSENEVRARRPGLEKTELAANLEKQSAILYQIVIFGEAVKRLSSDFRDRHPEVPWREIAGMRDLLTHQCDRVRKKRRGLVLLSSPCKV
jgi:uncharacterized protein with HEPN domain